MSEYLDLEAIEKAATEAIWPSKCVAAVRVLNADFIELRVWRVLRDIGEPYEVFALYSHQARDPEYVAAAAKFCAEQYKRKYNS